MLLRAVSAVICLGLLMLVPLAAAQEPQPDPAVPVQEATTAAQAKKDAEARLEEAYKALNKAEREFLETARAAQEARESSVSPSQASASEPASSSEPENAASPMPIDPADIMGKISQGWEKLLGWLTSIPFLAQLAVIIGAYLLAPILAAIVRKTVGVFRKPPAETARLKPVLEYVYRSRILLRGLVLIGILALSAIVVKSIPALGQDWLIKLAQGLAVVFVLYKAISEFIENDLFKKVAIWTLIPIGLMMVFGIFDEFKHILNSTELMAMGGTPITFMTVILLTIFGAIFFKLGNMVNARGQAAIRSQETLDVSTQEVIAKIFQIILYIVIFVLVLGAAKVPMSGLVVIFSALSLGIGLGLQPIAANFVSGLIILFDRSVRKGDFIVLPDGQEGFVDAINMRSTIVETTDGKDIMVPNTTFTEGLYENWTHKDPRQRYEVYFTVAYDTDIDQLEGLLIPAVSEHEKVLQEPEKPDLELREFGDFGIKFAIEFWASGIDDGENKFTSDLNFIVWRTLKAAGVTMPLPQREVRMLK